ncbi:hypothetical protein [Rhizobium sp. BK491]|uniref:hypothetical protein n=1 Tax=Rhizobium sp. BK491 TaxID=2587009 RepID=UPI0017F68BEA|nr:hypothetical protein [Rhizobium sp. BK491]MBB3567002.1 hypothetical protein [Rhizobium sp. BK491]
MFEGSATLVGSPEKKVRISLNERTGKLDIEQLYHSTSTVAADGTIARQITIDVRKKSEITKIIQRERKRSGLKPLPPEELAAQAEKCVSETVVNPVIQKTFVLKFSFLRHALFKIAYELAFLWLGEAYLDDPTAKQLREAILADDVASTDDIPGFAGEAGECSAFQFWEPHEAQHLAYASRAGNSIAIAVRIFDIYAGVVVISKEADRYLRAPNDYEQLRFLTIDANNGNSLTTSFADELLKISKARAGQ